MKSQVSVKNDSSIYRVIAASDMSEHERQLSLDALSSADMFADGVLWTMHKIEDLAHLFSKPDLKH